MIYEAFAVLRNLHNRDSRSRAREYVMVLVLVSPGNVKENSRFAIKDTVLLCD